MGWSEVERAFAEAVEQGVIPGATMVVRKADDIVFEGVFGYRSLQPERSPMRLDTVFDLSSLTKPLATTIAVMMLTRDGKLRLDDRVTRFFHNFGVHGKGYVTFRQVLAHCSGLAAWRPFYQQVAEVERGGKVNFMASRGAKEFVYEQIHREKPEYPPCSKALYSDLNFMSAGRDGRANQRSCAQSPLPRQDLFAPWPARDRFHRHLPGADAPARTGAGNVRPNLGLSGPQAAAGGRS